MTQKELWTNTTQSIAECGDRVVEAAQVHGGSMDGASCVSEADRAAGDPVPQEVADDGSSDDSDEYLSVTE